MPLDPMKVLHVERLLAQGELSQRKISELVGVARSSVAAIAERQCGLARQSDDPESQSPPTRCPGCGGLVFLPCRLCRMRSWLDRDQRRRAWRKRLNRE